MKVRIGFGLGTATSVLADHGGFAELVDALEAGGWDSLWLSDQLGGPAPDPIPALGFAAGRTQRLKFGTSVVVVPGRNPVVLAKQMATLDKLSAGRYLPIVGLGAVRPVEQSAFGVAREERAAWFDEALGLMRRLWSQDDVTHTGERFSVQHLSLGPKPAQEPFEVWLGGRARSELRRTGRSGDGWLPSFTTPEEVAEGWELVTATAAEHDRRIDPEHLGALVAYTRGPLDPGVRDLLAARVKGVDVDRVVAQGLDDLRGKLEAFIAVDASKFVVLPLLDPGAGGWGAELAEVHAAVGDLQT